MRIRDFDANDINTDKYKKLRYTKNTNKPCFTLVGQKYYFDTAFIQQLDIMFVDTKLCEMSRKQKEAWNAYVSAVESGSFDTMTEQLDVELGLIDYSETEEENK